MIGHFVAFSVSWEIAGYLLPEMGKFSCVRGDEIDYASRERMLKASKETN